MVYDMPLASWSVGSGPEDHLAIVVEADVETRVRRLVDSRGMAEDDARNRIAAQATDDQRRAVADVVLAKHRRSDDLVRAVDALWQQRLVPLRPTSDAAHGRRRAESSSRCGRPLGGARRTRGGAPGVEPSATACRHRRTSGRRPCRVCSPRTSSTCRWGCAGWPTGTSRALVERLRAARLPPTPPRPRTTTSGGPPLGQALPRRLRTRATSPTSTCASTAVAGWRFALLFATGCSPTSQARAGLREGRSSASLALPRLWLGGTTSRPRSRGSTKASTSGPRTGPLCGNWQPPRT